MGITKLIHKLLENPLIFRIQQYICNNYGNVRREFGDYLEHDGLNILDIGCSTGTAAKQVIDMKRNFYIGLDLDLPYVRIASRNNPNGNFLVMDGSNLGFRENLFDVIMFNGVWHHMDDALIRACMLDIKRVIKRDGVILVAEPVFTPGKFLSDFFLRRDRGKFIRSEVGYQSFFSEYVIHRQRFFNFSLHRFVSFVASPKVNDEK